MKRNSGHKKAGVIPAKAGVRCDAVAKKMDPRFRGDDAERQGENSGLLVALNQLPPLRETIKQHGLMAHKALGQHFLLDLNLTQRIVKMAGDLSDCTVFEIGPGPGGLTRPLLASTAKHIIAIEKDRRCVGALAELVEISEGKLEIVEGDALKIDLEKLSSAPRAIVANLPYNVGTPMLLNWIKQVGCFRSMTLMFQSEVVDRLIAPAGGKAYGRLSVIAQSCCNMKRVMSLPAKAFTPPPKVDSAVIYITPKADRPSDEIISALEKITAAAFGQRRKMLRSSLKVLGGEELLIKANIRPEQRAEELSVEEFKRLAICYLAG